MAGGQYILQAAEGSNQRRFEKEENRKNRVLNKYQVDANIDLGMKQIESGYTLGMEGIKAQRDIAGAQLDVQFELGQGQLEMSKYGHDITKYGMDLSNQFNRDRMNVDIDMFNVDAAMRDYQFNTQQDLIERRFDEIELPRFENEDRQIDFDFGRYKEYYEGMDQYYQDYLSDYEQQQETLQQRDELKASRQNRETYWLRDWMRGEHGFFEGIGNSLFDVARVRGANPLLYGIGVYNEEEELPFPGRTTQNLSNYPSSILPFALGMQNQFNMPNTNPFAIQNQSYFNQAAYPNPHNLNQPSNQINQYQGYGGGYGQGQYIR